MLGDITPVLLTYNEEQNVDRTLSRLAWAKDIVVVDSDSSDGTLAALAKFSNVRVFSRRFDTHANQWRYATEETGIGTNWLLRLDADYQVTDALVRELSRLDPHAAVNAYRIGFDYAIFSHKLVSSLYPSNTILMRKGCFSVQDKGHTEVWEVRGPEATLNAKIVHDDWKSTGHWLLGQGRYMQRELDRLCACKHGLSRWMRLRPPLMPLAIFLYCLFAKGLILNGRAGIFYALQRMTAEAILSLMVLERKLRSQAERDRIDHAREGIGRRLRG
jgi:glycosyltransferase involved in cell wall biosynthesis